MKIITNKGMQKAVGTAFKGGMNMGVAEGCAAILVGGAVVGMAELVSFGAGKLCHHFSKKSLEKKMNALVESAELEGGECDD